LKSGEARGSRVGVSSRRKRKRRKVGKGESVRKERQTHQSFQNSQPLLLPASPLLLIPLLPLLLHRLPVSPLLLFLDPKRLLLPPLPLQITLNTILIGLEVSSNVSFRFFDVELRDELEGPFFHFFEVSVVGGGRDEVGFGLVEAVVVKGCSVEREENERRELALFLSRRARSASHLIPHQTESKEPHVLAIFFRMANSFCTPKSSNLCGLKCALRIVVWQTGQGSGPREKMRSMQDSHLSHRRLGQLLLVARRGRRSARGGRANVHLVIARTDHQPQFGIQEPIRLAYRTHICRAGVLGNVGVVVVYSELEVVSVTRYRGG
jgi:hypothetical protein